MLAQFIQNKRRRGQITQDAAASYLGVTRATYSKLEHEPDKMNWCQLKRLADLFSMPVHNLINEVDNDIVIEGDKVDDASSNSLSIRVLREDVEKFKQVILHILCQVGGKPNVGEAVIHKLLYFIDFDYYEKHEENLIGLEYIKSHHGPTSIIFARVVGEMIEEGKIQKSKTKYYGYSQKKYDALVRPDLSNFSAIELGHINGVLNRLSDKNSAEMERYSHGDIPWKISKAGEVIPYESVFYRDEVYSVRSYEDDI